MRQRVVISFLVLALSAANASAAAFCALCCYSPLSHAVVATHHHDMPAYNQKPHVHNHACLECPSVLRMNQSSECNKLVESQAITEDFASKGRTGGNSSAPIGIGTLSENAVSLQGKSALIPRLDTSPSSRSSLTLASPLRI